MIVRIREDGKSLKFIMNQNEPTLRFLKLADVEKLKYKHHLTDVHMYKKNMNRRFYIYYQVYI